MSRIALFPTSLRVFFPKMFLEILVDFSSNMCLDFLGRCLEFLGEILGKSFELWEDSWDVSKC